MRRADKRGSGATRFLPARIIGDLGGSGSELRMPWRAPDDRCLTWEKLADELASKIAKTNAPASTSSCWFLPGRQSDGAGYPMRKISARGNRNNIAHVLKCYREINELTLKVCEDVIDLSLKLTTRVNRCTEIDQKTLMITEGNKILIFLAALGDEYDTFRELWMGPNSVIKKDGKPPASYKSVVQAAILHEYTLKERERKRTIDEQRTAMVARSENRCTYCHRTGHIIDKCWVKYPVRKPKNNGIKKGKNQKGKAVSDSIKDLQVKLARYVQEKRT
ncbi:hypothetical protein VB005_10382 [Metarhizium brunneum]